MADIKPIETLYNGHRFRSRLEARWAVFFDEAQVPYDYEMEGYELGDGVRYLPDFFLPHLGVHVEAKPHHDLPLADLRKLVMFAADGDMPLLLIVGTPGSEDMYLLTRHCLEAWEEPTEERDADFVAAVFWETVRDWAHVEFGFLPQSNGMQLVYRTLPPQADSVITRARAAARQARFEHGARPK